jgi:cyclase
MTPSETVLWHHLRNKSIGYKFRPQHPIWRFVVDFYCHESKLIVEVDGLIHAIEEVKLNDIDREKILTDFGLNIIRFSNEIVLNDIQAVLDQIKSTISKTQYYKSPLSARAVAPWRRH